MKWLLPHIHLTLFLNRHTMALYALAFLLGDVFLQTFAELPTTGSLYLICIASLLLISILPKRPLFYFLLALVLGFVYTAWYANQLLAWQLSKEIENKPITVTGYIKSIPINENNHLSFIFALKHALIKLSWYQTKKQSKLPELKVGEKWQLSVRLKRMHATQSKGAFDYEAWGLQHGIRAEGVVIAKNQQHLLAAVPYRYPLTYFRQIILTKLQMILPHSNTSPWLLALITGERIGIDPLNWEILRNTGTNHLMAIAGLHIGVLAGLFHMLINWIWRRLPRLCLLLPAQLASACGAFLFALGYSALAGFSLPTERASTMLGVMIYLLISRQLVNAWQVFGLALLLVLLQNPLCLLTQSFWLSFGTIAIIIFGMRGRLGPHGFWWKWGRVQTVIAIGLIPISFALFHETSLIAFLANSIAIPWLSFLILPFCMLALLFLFVAPSLSHLLLWCADTSLQVLWSILTWFAHLPISILNQAIPTHYILMTTIVGTLLFLLPRGFPGKLLAILWFLPLITYKPSSPAHAEVWISILDVGQGLSVLIRTSHHTLLYDTGPKYHTGMDMGEAVVVPYLQQIGIKKLDMLMISHGDNDHIGGSKKVMAALPIGAVKTSDPKKFIAQFEKPLLVPIGHCYAGSNWQWDGVQFNLLHPAPNHTTLGNDSSCVLRISNGQSSILLTGDIEKTAEAELLTKQIQFLKADVLVAPHHGSKTSGVPAFLDAVNPRYVIYATGYLNRYHFPHAPIVAAYKKLNTQQLNTAELGTIEMHIPLTQRPEIRTERVDNHRYWYD